MDKDDKGRLPLLKLYHSLILYYYLSTLSEFNRNYFPAVNKVFVTIIPLLDMNGYELL